MKQKLIQDSEMLAKQLEDEANHIYELLIQAKTTIEELTNEYYANNKTLDDVISHAKEREHKNKENAENLYGIISLYKMLIGDEAAKIVENLAKRFLENSKKENTEKELKI